MTGKDDRAEGGGAGGGKPAGRARRPGGGEPDRHGGGSGGKPVAGNAAGPAAAAGNRAGKDAGSDKGAVLSHDPGELLVEMKDTSELMVDLAYGSVFYDSKRLAKVVEELEEEMGDHLLALQRRVLEMVRQGELPIHDALVALRVAQAAEVIANSALEIADVVLREVELHPVLAESIRESDSSITKISLHADCEFIGPRLREIELETETGMRILAVRRGNRWRSKVRGGFRLAAQDTVIAMGPEEAIPSFRKRCDPTVDE